MVIYEALCFDVAQGQMNGAPSETFMRVMSLLETLKFPKEINIFDNNQQLEMLLERFSYPLFIQPAGIIWFVQPMENGRFLGYMSLPVFKGR